jgi:hypothetical protein
MLALVALVCALALIPIAGMWLDASRLFEERRSAQATADLAATATAFATCERQSDPDAMAAGLAAAAINGYDNDGVSNTVSVSIAPGTRIASASIVSHVGTTFSSLFGITRLTVSADAKAACTADGAGPIGAIWAGGDDCTKDTNGKFQLDVSGADQTITGGVRVNGDVNLGAVGTTWTDRPAPVPPPDPFEYVGVMWPSTVPPGNSFDAGYPRDVGPDVPTPGWPAGWEPSVVDPAASNEAYWAVWRSRAVADGHGSLIGSKITTIDTGGVYYTESADGMDISSIANGSTNVTLVARNGPIKMSASNRSLSPATSHDSVAMLSGLTYSGDERCDKYSVAISGQNIAIEGVIWAPGGLAELSGSDTSVTGTVVAWSVRLNGSRITVDGDPTLTQTPATVRLLE